MFGLEHEFAFFMKELSSAAQQMGIGALCLGAYLLGSIPFGLLLTYLSGLGDLRHMGSGNIGATNVLRTGSKKLAILTLILDMLKGALPFFLGQILFGPAVGLLAGASAFLGHIFPIWLRGRGGKGVATYLGILFALSSPMGFLFLLVWFFLVFVTKRVAPASLGAAAASAILLVFLQKSGFSIFVLMALLIWNAHRHNIVRLWQGTEPHLGIFT